MNVTFILYDPCAVCGCIRKAYRFPDVRVNKGSLRSVGTYLAVTPRACPECDWDGPPAQPERWWLDPRDVEKIRAHRDKKWPGAA